MSDLSELIKINKNIERQNEEIIRLLKKIAGEKEPEKEEDKLDVFSKMVSKSLENTRTTMYNRKNGTAENTVHAETETNKENQT